MGDECELRIRAFEPNCPSVQPCALLPSGGGVICTAFQQSAAGCVILVGERFRNVSAVDVGGTAISRFETCDENALVFEHVAGASGAIQVTTSEGSTTSAGQLCPPTPPACTGLAITDFAPRAASPGAWVIVFGCGFVQGSTQVTLGSITTPALYLTDTAVAFQVPFDSSSSLVTVTTPQDTVTSSMVLTVP